MTTPPQFRKDRILEMFEQFRREEQHRIENEKKATEKRKKAFLDKLAIAIALLAAAFTGWQGWEAHETRKTTLRAFVGVTAEFKPSEFVQVTLHPFGASPATNVVVRAACIHKFGANQHWQENMELRDIDKGDTLIPGLTKTFNCYAPPQETTTPPGKAYQSVLLKGQVAYSDIFNVKHHTNFCFYQELTPGEGLVLTSCPQYNDAS